MDEGRESSRKEATFEVVFEDEQKFGWWIGVWSEGTTIQTEGTAQAKACSFKGMVPWNFVELVVSVVCLKQRMIEIMLLHLLKNHEHSSLIVM